MEQFILLLVLTGGSHAFFPPADTECDAIQATSSCSPVVGGSVNIKLLTNAAGYKLHCFKFYNETNRAEIFSLKREKVKVAENNRTEFTIDTGTLKIINVTWNDTGLYVVERYDKNGKREADIKFNLQVQANFYPILLLCSAALGVLLLIVLLTCCICCILKKRRNTKGKGNRQTL